MTGQEYCVVLTTTSSREEADELARRLLENRLAACVQIQPVHSFYIWNGAVQSGDECLLIIKTRRALYGELETCIRRNHAYDVPEIVCLPIEKGSTDYLRWIDSVTRT